MKHLLRILSVWILVLISTTFGAYAQQFTPNIIIKGTVSIQPGDLVVLTGEHFGTTPPKDLQLCLELTHCTLPGDIISGISSWTDTSITIEIPDSDFPKTGQLYLYFPTNKVLTAGPEFVFTRPSAQITSISPTTITPFQTEITIQGTNFGTNPEGKGNICIRLTTEDYCLSEEGLALAQVQWNDHEIRFKLPLTTTVSTSKIVLYIHRYTSISGKGIMDRAESPTIQIIPAKDPTAQLTSSSSIIPGVTEIHIQGSGFGSAYITGQNQICFPTICIPDEDIKKFLTFWSDTEIRFITPEILNTKQTVSLELRLFHPSVNDYKILSVPGTLSITPRPTISRYYTSMENNTSYGIWGQYFGSTPGMLLINNQSVFIESWSDSYIAFQTPDLPTASTSLRIISQSGAESSPLAVNTIYKKRYSRDPLSYAQWYLGLMEVESAWSLTKDKPGVVVAVLDSGIDTSHEDLQGMLWKNTKEIPGNGIDDDNNGYVDDIHGWNAVNNSGDISPINSHGNIVASIIGARKDNNIGIAGIAPNSKIMPIVVTTKANGKMTEDYIEYDAVKKAIEYAVANNARIITMSFGAKAPKGLYTSLMKYAHDHNVLLIASAGNSAIDLDTSNASPVCDDGDQNFVIGVAALDKNSRKAAFSNYGKTCIDISAPGVDILGAALMWESASGGLPYLKSEGTSFASPIVAGSAALLWSLNPDWNVDQIKKALLSSATPLSDQSLGKGVLNIRRLLETPKPASTYKINHASTLVIGENNTVITIDKPVLSPIDTLIEQEPVSTMLNEITHPFPDVPSSHKNASAIAYLKQREILEGYPDGTFRPETPVNRAEFLKILFEAQNASIPSSFKSCFPDVRDEWFAPYVCFAKAKGIIEGYKQPNGTFLFQPAKTINKAEATKMLIGLFGIETNESLSSFQDIPPSAWYTPFVTAAERLNLLEEKGSALFAPGEFMQRATISEMVYRILSMQERSLTQFQY